MRESPLVLNDICLLQQWMRNHFFKAVLSNTLVLTVLRWSTRLRSINDLVLAVLALLVQEVRPRGLLVALVGQVVHVLVPYLLVYILLPVD
jgi:hypothetical protein